VYNANNYAEVAVYLFQSGQFQSFLNAEPIVGVVLAQCVFFLFIYHFVFNDRATMQTKHGIIFTMPFVP